MARLRVPRTKAGKQEKVQRVMREFKHGMLHTGSKKGPMVRSRKQAVAIAMSESGMKRRGG
jgi:hypothetical protein